jgi:hypothetical protein
MPRIRPSLLLVPLLLVLVPLAACVPGPPPPASQYRQAETVSRLPLVFVAGSAQLTEAENARLRMLRLGLPVQAVPALQADGLLAERRANEVARRLGRPVQLQVVPGMPPDQALLVTWSPAIVADACRGPGERELGSIWPSNDDMAPVLLPPGCAAAVDIQAQVTAPGDLLQGRPLPPGAATPFAAAIERYYHRNDPPQSNAASGGNSAGSDQSGSTAASGSTPAVLVGPLPSGGQTGQ